MDERLFDSGESIYYSSGLTNQNEAVYDQIKQIAIYGLSCLIQPYSHTAISDRTI